MIANNSSDARVPVYGTTADHVISLKIVMADGRIEKIGPGHETLRAERAKIDNLIRAHVREMSERMPPGLMKRWPGYGLERFLREPGNLNEILAGSEGTLAAIFSAELKISPLPREKGLGLIFFASVSEAMQATVELLDLKPAAIEHIDRPLRFARTRRQTVRIDSARRVLRRCRRAIVDVASEETGIAHEDSDRYHANEPGLVGAQSRSLAFNRLHWASQAGGVH